MRWLSISWLSCWLAAASATAQPSAANLAVPPPDAQQMSIVSSAGRHGSMQFWTAADGRLMGRMSLVLRGQVWEQDEAITIGPDGAIAEYRLRGFGPQGDVAETFHIADGTARWQSQSDAGSTAYATPAMYVPAGWPIRALNVLAERLVTTRRPQPLLPAGSAQIEELARATVGSGAAAQTVVAWIVTGLQGTPVPFWTDMAGRTFADIGGLSTLRAGYEDAEPLLRKVQDDALARRIAALARNLVTVPDGPVVFRNVRAFIHGQRFAQRQTVVVRAGKIVALGRTGSVPVPRGAQVIDGRGKTLVPGLWDSHMHVGDDYTGTSELSLGVTSARDPGNHDALSVARGRRRAAGELLSPRVYASSMLDGQHANSAQFATVVTSLPDALRAVDAAKAQGQAGVKLYGSLDPAWVAPVAGRARRHGLHLHGHLPAGMRPMHAIAAGYREITHINFVAMQAMPLDVVARSNGIARIEGMARFAKDLDFDREPMHSLIAVMAARRIAVDPTLVVFEAILADEKGELSAAYAPFVGAVPPVVERSFRQGGFAPPAGTTRADTRAGFRKLQELVYRLHRAGVPVVAGTDGGGMELVRELELYVEAGLSPAQALATATSVPARLVGADRHTGSIAVGKDADLLLVDGDPSRRIGDLRRTQLVMMAGQLMQADRLRAAVGVSRRPAHALVD